MFVIDDLLLLPARGFHWIVREIHHAAEEEIAGEADAITARLGELYMMLEAGQLTEESFEEKEKELLDRLDSLREGSSAGEEEDDE
jgi:hypothetical protein